MIPSTHLNNPPNPSRWARYFTGRLFISLLSITHYHMNNLALDIQKGLNKMIFLEPWIVLDIQ